MDQPPLLPQSVEVPPVIPESHEKSFQDLTRTGAAGRKRRKVPWPLLIVLLFTVPAIIVFGPAAAGIAIFGGAIGLPVLLVFFFIALSVVGLITLIKSLRR